jgi:flagellar protein FlgJ
MEYPTIRPIPSAVALTHGRTPGTLRETTREFEGLFVSHLLQSMRRTVPQGGWLGAGLGQQVFRDMLDQEWARQIAFSGAFGLGDLLYEQLGGARQTAEGDHPVEAAVTATADPETGRGASDREQNDEN